MIMNKDQTIVQKQAIKIRYWIWLGYLVPVSLSCLSALGVWIQSRVVTSKVEELDHSILIQKDIGDLSFEIQVTSRATRGYLLDPSPVSLSTFETANNEIINVLFPRLDEEITNQSQQDLFEELKSSYFDLNQTNNQIISITRANGVAAGTQVWKDGGARQQAEKIQNLLNQFQDNESEIVQENVTAHKQALGFLVVLVVMLTVASAAISGFLSVGLVNWIIKRIYSNTSSLASSSNQIVSAVEEQERISNQQAASVNETTSTVEELNSSSRQSAEQAETASQAAQKVLELAQSGNQAVDESLASMGDVKTKVGAIADQIVQLNEKTGQIGSISQLVSDLANQTNMLALNAAVEAVRAGEHGKGFSVVAAEIRKLADQSKQSADRINVLVRDIQQSITQTVKVTEEGTSTVDSTMGITKNTAEAFAGVSEAINNVVLNNQQIFLNIRQQASAIQQIADAMNSLNQGAKETVKGLSQTRIGTQMLNGATKNLQELF